MGNWQLSLQNKAALVKVRISLVTQTTLVRIKLHDVIKEEKTIGRFDFHTSCPDILESIYGLF